MSKRIIQAFIILIIILFGVSLISESNDRVEAENAIDSFEESVNKEEEIENGNIVEVYLDEEDSSNLISDINAKMATFIVGVLNGVLGIGLKLIEGLTN